MFDYYAKSIDEIKKMIKENKIPTRIEWDEYKTGKPLWSANSMMWVYCATEDWDTFIEKLKEEI